MKVFVSGATDDMGEFRRLICTEPAKWWGKPRGVPELCSMLDAKAEAIPPIEWSMREAARADVLVLLLGNCHGALAETPPTGSDSGLDIDQVRARMQDAPNWDSVDKPAELSYTQWEILAAMTAGVPILIFSPDRKSKDADLSHVREASADQDPSLTRRQEVFGQWLRSGLVEDHFASRTDLLNKVRTGLNRLQRRRFLRYGSWVVAGLLIVAAACAYFGGGGDPPPKKDKQERAAAAHRKMAFATGSALAMLGQSSTGVGATVFEHSLKSLRLGDNDIQSLCHRYKALVPGRQEQELKTLRQDVIGKILVLLGPSVSERVNLGFSTIRLVILLNSWEQLAAQGDVKAASKELVALLRSSAQKSQLDAEMQRELAKLDPEQFARSAYRKSAAAVISKVVAIHDMEPAASGGESEN